MNTPENKRAGLFHRYGMPSKHQRLRNALNVAFIILAAATIAIYFTVSGTRGTYLFFGLGLIAVFTKMVETAIRANENRNKKHDDKR